MEEAESALRARGRSSIVVEVGADWFSPQEDF
jgi:hypothetical protein